jgi:hypothetical protein
MADTPAAWEPNVWDYLHRIYADHEETHERIESINLLEEPERTEKANELLTAVWSYLAQE